MKPNFSRTTPVSNTFTITASFKHLVRMLW